MGRPRSLPSTFPRGATALAIAPDYAGTIWETAGSHVYRSRDGGHSWHGLAYTDAVGVAFLEKAVVVVDGTHVGVGGFGAARLAEHRAGRSIVAVSSPYYRTSRLYGLDPERRAVALGARRPAVGATSRGGPPDRAAARCRRCAATR